MDYAKAPSITVRLARRQLRFWGSPQAIADGVTTGRLLRHVRYPDKPRPPVKVIKSELSQSTKETIRKIEESREAEKQHKAETRKQYESARINYGGRGSSKVFNRIKSFFKRRTQ